MATKNMVVVFPKFFHQMAFVEDVCWVRIIIPILNLEKCGEKKIYWISFTMISVVSINHP
jgi:hypothetical protein